MDYQSFPRAPGVYCIEHLGSGKLYIGSSLNAHNRILHHFWLLAHRRHCNRHLQRAYDKYGVANFAAYVVELCDVGHLHEREGWWFDVLRPFGDRGYNIAHDTTASRRGAVMSPEQRAKLSVARKGRRVSPEVRARMIGHTLSAEARAKISAAQKGRPHSAEHRAKILAALQRRYSENARAKASKHASKPHISNLEARRIRRNDPWRGWQRLQSPSKKAYHEPDERQVVVQSDQEDVKTRTVATAMPMREYHALKRIARQQGTTLAGLVRGLLVAFLRTVAEKQEQRDEPEADVR